MEVKKSNRNNPYEDQEEVKATPIRSSEKQQWAIQFDQKAEVYKRIGTAPAPHTTNINDGFTPFASKKSQQPGSI